MKQKMLAICSSVAALHLVIGGAIMLGGCTGVQDDEPMPSGAFLPSATKTDPGSAVVQPPATSAETPELGPETVTPTQQEPKVIDDEPEDTPAPEQEKPATPPAVKPAPQKGGQPAAKPVRTDDIEYVVKKGDSYWKIARQFGVSVKDLVNYNTIAPEKLRPGQKIKIPATGKKVTKPAAKPSAKPPVKVKKTYAPIPADGIYIVKKGDSFDKIGRMFGLAPAAIAEYNNLSLNKFLQVNQKLKLPPRKEGAAAKPAPVKEPAPTKKPAASDASSSPEAPVESAPEAPAAPTTEDSAAPVAPIPPEAPKVPAALSEVVMEDTTVAAFAKKWGYTEAQIREKNPQLPSDGIIKSGTTVVFP